MTWNENVIVQEKALENTKLFSISIEIEVKIIGKNGKKINPCLTN